MVMLYDKHLTETVALANYRGWTSGAKSLDSRSTNRKLATSPRRFLYLYWIQRIRLLAHYKPGENDQRDERERTENGVMYFPFCGCPHSFLGPISRHECVRIALPVPCPQSVVGWKQATRLEFRPSQNQKRAWETSRRFPRRELMAGLALPTSTSGCSSLAKHVRKILRSGERQRTSGRPVCLSAPRDITRCVKLSLGVRARRATPVAGTP